MMDGLSLPDFPGLFFGSGAETRDLGVFGTGGLPFAQQRFQPSGPIRLFRCVVRADIRQTAKLPQDLPKRHTEGVTFALLPLQLLVKPQALGFQRLYAIHPLQRFPAVAGDNPAARPSPPRKPSHAASAATCRTRAASRASSAPRRDCSKRVSWRVMA